MKADRIRTKWVEIIARAFYEAEADDVRATTGKRLPSWDGLDKSDAHSAIQDARLAVNALEAAGQLPTDDLKRKVAAVRRLHFQYRAAACDDFDCCAHCNWISGGYVPWPCDTYKALTGETE